MDSFLESDEMLTKFTSLMYSLGSKVGKPKKVKVPTQKEQEKIVIVNVPELPKGFQVKHDGQIKNIETKRLNKIPKDWNLPQELLNKYTPTHAIGNIYRIQEILNRPDSFFEKVATVAGWARTVRPQQKDTLVFIELSDGSGFKSLQVVVDQAIPNFKDLLKANIGFSFKITGKFVKSPAKGQAIELLVNDPTNHQVIVCGTTNPEEYPMAKGKQNPETLREKAHLRPRSNLIGAVTRIRNNLAYATHVFFQSHAFYYIHTPIITASDCEGAGEMFQVTTVLPKDNLISSIPVNDQKMIDYTQDFFKRPASLTVSGQLAVENFCCSLSNVYTFGPTFRAENSHTARHLAEFWMIEPELAFADLYDNMDCAEAYVKFCIKYCLNNNQDDLQFLDERVKKGLVEYLREISNQSFYRVSYTEGIEILLEAEKQGAKFEKKVSWGMDLGSEHERFLAEKVFKKPVILYNYPKEIKAFYMKVEEDGKCVRAMDILIPQVGELIGGSQREEDYETLVKRIKDCNLNEADYWWYLDLRRYGTVPHCGFGLGFERLVMMVTGVENIRDVIPFPRYPGNAEF